MIKNLLFSILSWVIAFNLIIFFRNYGQPGELHWPNMIISANASAIVVAIIFSLVDTYHDKLRVKPQNFPPGHSGEEFSIYFGRIHCDCGGSFYY